MWSSVTGFIWASRFNQRTRVSCVESRVWTPTRYNFTVFKVLTLCSFLFAVRYFSNPLTKRNHFGRIGGVDFNLLFSLWKIILTLTGTNEERQVRLIKGTTSTLQELISNGIFESTSYHLFRKPVFLLETPLKKMRRFYLTGATNGSVKLGSIVSSSLTWNGCFRYHICSSCLFLIIRTRIWSERSRV